MADEAIKVTDSTKIPAGAKKPQDRKEKIVIEDGYRVLKIRGVEVRIIEDAFDDFEFLDELSYVEQNPGYSGRLLRRLVGAETSRELLEKVRDPETKRVSIEAGSGLLEEILEAATPNS